MTDSTVQVHIIIVKIYSILEIHLSYGIKPVPIMGEVNIGLREAQDPLENLRLQQNFQISPLSSNLNRN